MLHVVMMGRSVNGNRPKLTPHRSETPSVGAGTFVLVRLGTWLGLSTPEYYIDVNFYS
jgi:hypothetical protein